MSNYPNGIDGLVLKGIPIVQSNPGRVVWVNGSSVPGIDGVLGADSSTKGSYHTPVATIDAAVALCTANRGDLIIVAPGHTETVSAASGITLDVAGIAVIGLGRGSLRPTITLDTAATASVVISAASVTVANCLFVAGFADITRIIDVTGTDATIHKCEFIESGANLNWVDVIDASGADNTADGLTVTECDAYAVDAACDSFIEITGDISRLTVEDCHVVHDHANATAFIEQATGKDMINVSIRRNHYDSLKASGDVLIDNDTTANSGIVANNTCSHGDTTGEVLVDADGVALIDNKGTGVITASAYLLPAVDS